MLTDKELELYNTPKKYINLFFDALDPKFGIHNINKALELGCGQYAPFCEVLKERRGDQCKTYGVDCDLRIKKDPRPVDKFLLMNTQEIGSVYRGTGFDLVVFNPPFSHSEAFLKAALKVVRYQGLVVMLNRAQFIGGQRRYAGLHTRVFPEYIFYSPDRISFTGDGKVDCWDVAFFVYVKGVSEHPTPNPETRLILLESLKLKG